MAEKKIVVAFDFDGTLISADSLFVTARHVLGTGKMLSALLRTMPAIVKWKLGFSTNSRAKEKLFANFYKGMPVAELDRAGRELIPVFDSIIRKDVFSRMEKHRDEGHTLVMVTASLSNWVKPWALEKGFVDVIATEAEIDAERRLTGRFSTPNCYGQEKVRRFLEAYPMRAQYALCAYGDSSSDEPLLAFADKAVRCKNKINTD